jgi:uncharacterized protein YlxW (UPF0749 family)
MRGTSASVTRMGPGMKRTPGWQVAVPAVAAVAGMLFAASAFTADGTDLRSTTTDLSTLVTDRAEEVEDLRGELPELREEKEALQAEIQDAQVEQARAEVDRLEPQAGMLPVSGSGLVVTLDDAPQEALEDPSVDPNLLVVHQQDIQAFVNALWAAGANAISLQGQRLISTTGIKCVGNTVVLEGVPYSPPYRIEAVGDVSAMRAGLDDSRSVQIYNDYVDVYGLGLSVDDADSLDIPGYDVAPELRWAEPID